VAWRQTPSAGVLRADGVVVPSIMVPPGSEAKPGHRSATIGTQPSKILDPEQRGKGVDSKDSLGRFMNPWEIPAEAVIYSRAKESMRSGSGPRLFTLHWNTRETPAQNV
jgi:hypothetical protein